MHLKDEQLSMFIRALYLSNNVGLKGIMHLLLWSYFVVLEFRCLFSYMYDNHCRKYKTIQYIF